jgi:RNA polymerase sigma factor (sigma-70 family)
MDSGADAMAVPARLRWPAAAAVPADTVEDEVLLRRIGDGDGTALAALYQRHAGRLFGFLQRCVGDPMVAEEVLQDTLLAVWRSADRYAGRSSARTWLFGIARRQAHNRLRVRQPPFVALDSLADRADPAPGPEQHAIAAIQGAAAATAFAGLAATHREVLALAFAARISHQEIAEILEIPVGTVKSRLHHARAALATALAERGYLEEL